MKLNKYRNSFFLCASILILFGCTKLNEKLNSTLTSTEATQFSDLFLQGAYNDIGLIYCDPGNVGQLQEVSADESFIPIRGTDWFDGGYHVQLHLHNWTRASLANAGITHSVFISLNKLNFDATSVLGTKATNDQFAQAKFLRALACYQLLDLFGQFPLRQPNENLLLPSKVYSGDSAIQFLISELNYCVANLNTSNAPTQANINAARALLMKLYLNRGSFLNLTQPTFADADMQQVITLGNSIVNSGNYSFGAYYFDAFNATNSGTPEAIFSLPSVPSTKPYYPGLQNQWFVTLHYNSYDGGDGGLLGSAGWNGYATMGDFYNTFGVNGTTLTQTASDTTVDQRLGGRYYKGVTDKSGLKEGLLIGQQYNQKGAALQDRKGNPLIFTNAANMPASIDASQLPAFETVGIRVLKYTPDFTNATSPSTSYKFPGNYYIMLRYADVMLMIAEAKMRQASPDNSGALAIVNQLREKRGAVALNSMTLVNKNNVYDPNTLLSERGRELYWEYQRRTDMIRFGVFGNAFFLHPADGGKYYVFPLAQQDLDANPNLLPNIQGTSY